MDAFIKFLQAFFSFVIIIPLSLFCLLPLKNQLKYPISKICSLLSGYKIKYSRHTKVNLERDWLFLF